MAHLTLLLVLLWVGTTVSTVVDVDKRIIGGRQCNRDQRGYHVRLKSFSRTHEIPCGGSLIKNGWILTVAHCWEPGFTISAFLGVHRGQGVRVRITAPPRTFPPHDIMLLKLPAGTRIPPGVQPIKLGNCNARPGLNAPVQIAGHAGIFPGPNNRIMDEGKSPTLQCANVNVADCGNIDDILNETQSTRQHWFCGHTPGVDICCGDSGGGVVYNNRLYGLIRGSAEHLNDLPLSFVNLCHQDFTQWIRQTAVR